MEELAKKMGVPATRCRDHLGHSRICPEISLQKQVSEDDEEGLAS